jgi:hypothetical protein
MWPFRRRREQTLNEILLHEAGLDAAPSAQPEAPPAPVDPFEGAYPTPRPANFSGADYAVYADRLDGGLWEVRAVPL